MNKLDSIIKLLKIKHYIKNFVVFIPLIFSLKFIDIKSSILSIGAFCSFCLIASAIYIFNDIFDVENDKKHPIKRNRPIASGAVSISEAWKLFFTTVLISFTLSLLINKLLFLTILIYLILNIWYSLKLKFLPIIDVVCIAFGFVLRILAGCAAIKIIPSPLVILLTFFTSMFFTFSKRKLEFELVNDKTTCRKSINEYNISLLNQFITINAVLSIAFYFTYMLDSVTIQKTGTEYMYVTVIPFTIIIFRLLLKIYTCKNNDDPAEFIYKDKTLKTLMFVYLVVLFSVLYFK